MNLGFLLGKTMVLKRTPPKYFAGFFKVFQKFNKASITFVKSLID